MTDSTPLPTVITQRWSSVTQLADRWCEEGEIPALALLAGSDDSAARLHHHCGRQRLEDDNGTLQQDAIFLVASITKPVVAMGAMLLVERGLLTLNDRVTQYLPEFAKHSKKNVTIRHLLTHTSGLPDMLPDNQRLRKTQSPLSTFVEQTCDIELSFAAGFGVQYQSMGFAILGEIVHRTTGRTCAEFLQEEIFTPLGMIDTSLGMPEEWKTGLVPKRDRIAEIQVPKIQQSGTDWNWNSDYWRQLGAPWGGLLTTTHDLAIFAEMMLNRGQSGERQLFSPATIDAATTNQLDAFRDLHATERRTRPWGFGWRLNWPAHSHNFGDLASPNAYGHWGATGTVLWIDPLLKTYAMIFTTLPLDDMGSRLNRLANTIEASR